MKTIVTRCSNILKPLDNESLLSILSEQDTWREQQEQELLEHIPLWLLPTCYSTPRQAFHYFDGVAISDLGKWHTIDRFADVFRKYFPELVLELQPPKFEYQTMGYQHQGGVNENNWTNCTCGMVTNYVLARFLP